jgi:hypothetical protein
MARVSGLEKNQAPWHLRWFYGVMRKMFGKDLTPAKVQMRFCPGSCGAASLWKPLSGANDWSLCVIFNWEESALLRALVVRFE